MAKGKLKLVAERPTTTEVATEQYRRRTQAFAKWFEEQREAAGYPPLAIQERLIAEQAFVAGWKARKKNDYYIAFGVDKRKQA